MAPSRDEFGRLWNGSGSVHSASASAIAADGADTDSNEVPPDYNGPTAGNRQKSGLQPSTGRHTGRCWASEPSRLCRGDHSCQWQCVLRCTTGATVTGTACQCRGVAWTTHGQKPCDFRPGPGCYGGSGYRASFRTDVPLGRCPTHAPFGPCWRFSVFSLSTSTLWAKAGVPVLRLRSSVSRGCG